MPKPRKGIVKRPKDRTCFVYDWTIDGRRFRGSTGEDQDRALAERIALQKRQEILARLKLGEAPPPAEITLNEALARAWMEHYQHLTWGDSVQHLSRNLLRILGKDTPLSAIDGPALAGYVATRRGERWRNGKTTERTAGARTINHELKVLAKVLRLAAGWNCHLPEVAPRAFMINPPAPRHVFLSADQAERLLAALVPHARRPVLFGIYTGLRRDNWLRVAWEQIDLESDAPRASVIAKGQRWHTAPLPTPAVELLQAIEPDPPKRSGPVFTFGHANVACSCWHCRAPDRRGAPIKSVRRAFKTAARAIGVPELRPHDLRHTFASWLLAKGYTLRHLQDALGHADIGTTRIYSHLEQGAAAAAVNDTMGGFRPRYGTHKTREAGKEKAG